MKKTRKFLTFALFSFISIASFATSHKIDSEETIENNDKKIDEDFGNILEELEEIDENENPSYSSKIFFSSRQALYKLLIKDTKCLCCLSTCSIPTL